MIKITNNKYFICTNFHLKKSDEYSDVHSFELQIIIPANSLKQFNVMKGRTT